MTEKIKMKIGEFLVKNNIMTIEQVEDVLGKQKLDPKKNFGSISLELGYIDDEVINKYIIYIHSLD